MVKTRTLTLSAIIICISLVSVCTGSEAFFLSYGPYVDSVEVSKEKNQVIITMRESPRFMYPEGGGPPDRIWKDIYGVVDGQIELVETVEAEVTQEHTVPESVVWPE